MKVPDWGWYLHHDLVRLRNLAWSFPKVFISLRLVVGGLGLAQISCARMVVVVGWWGGVGGVQLKIRISSQKTRHDQSKVHNSQSQLN